MMSERIYLNNDWKFAEQFEASMTEAAYDDSVCRMSGFHIPVRKRRFTILMNTAIRWSAVIEE